MTFTGTGSLELHDTTDQNQHDINKAPLFLVKLVFSSSTIVTS